MKNIVKQLTILKTKLTGSNSSLPTNNMPSGSNKVVAANAADAAAKVTKVVHGLDLPTRVSVTPRYSIFMPPSKPFNDTISTHTNAFNPLQAL